MGYPKKPVVLVVDDTIANIRILDDLLRGEYTVRVATNGATALRLALSEPRPDIVLLDIMMPDMDGYEVCRRLKSDPLTSNIAVVFITAMGNEEHEAKGLDLGAVDFIAKPFQPRLVRARVSNHVALKKYNDELNSLVKERTKELYLSRSVTVECLASVVETRDNETGAHVRRTQHGVEILAKRLRLMRPDIWDDDDDTIELFRVCAPARCRQGRHSGQHPPQARQAHGSRIQRDEEAHHPRLPDPELGGKAHGRAQRLFAPWRGHRPYAP